MLFTSNPNEPYHFLFNAEFDFKLRQGTITPQIQHSVEAMAPLFCPALSQNDHVLSSMAVESSFYKYLDSLDIPYATLIPLDKNHCLSKPQYAEAWGWSSDAIKLLSNYHFNIDHPNANISTVVNKRSFSHQLLDIKLIGTPCSKVINNSTQLNNHLVENSYIELIIKPLHGNSGAGFIRLSPPYQQELIEQAKTTVLNEGAVIESWLDRIDDFATLFHVAKDGTITTIGSHRNICNANGAFYGTLISNDDPLILEHSHQIKTATKEIGKALHTVGYFGIVSFDSFTYREQNQIKTAYGIDINCRYTMSYIAHMLKRKTESSTLFYRFIAKRRHKLPDNYRELTDLVGDINYSPEKKRGVFLASPLRIRGSDGMWRQPPRSAFTVIGDSIKDVLNIDETLRNRILKSKK